MKFKKIFKIPILYLTAFTLISGTAIQLSSCGHNSNSHPPKSNTWNDFKTIALNETAPNLLKQVKVINNFHWSSSDISTFFNGGEPTQKGANQEIIATIVIRGKDAHHNYPINFDIKYQDGVAYDVANWTYSQDPKLTTWTDFKKLALAEPASALLAQISDVTKYWWTKNNVAIFGSEQSPHQKGSSQEIVATIIIKGENEYLNYPINFDIKFDYTTYNIKKWTYSQVPDINKWNDFKRSVLDLKPSDFLRYAKNWNKWGDCKWIGKSTQQKWQANDLPEFDFYGGSGAANDPYKGMKGHIINDLNKTITVIISIKGKGGAYDSNPFKASINDSDNKVYNKNLWVFSQTQQLQSQIQHDTLANQEIQKLKSGTTKTDWAEFFNNNWVNGIYHTNTVASILDAGGFPGTSSHNWRHLDSAQVAEPIIGGTRSIIVMRLQANDSDVSITLISKFIWNDQKKNNGPAFNYTWDMTFGKPTVN